MPLYCLMLTGIQIDYRGGLPKVKVIESGGPIVAGDDAEANEAAKILARKRLRNCEQVSRAVALVPEHLIRQVAEVELGYARPAELSARKQRRKERGESHEVAE